MLAPQLHAARCSFEFVYFSRPDSVWHGRSVHHVRQQLGIELARESPTDADVVIPVPDSSIPAAIGYSAESGIRFNDGLIKNRYIGRTFIEPTQDIRERGVALKFNALRENLEGRRVVMIDDSLVRGTTAGPLVKLVRDAGAAEVHLKITCPPITHACHFGVDMGHDGDLIAATLSVEEMRAHIGADSLAFLSLDGMMRAISSGAAGRTTGTATPASPAGTRSPSARPSRNCRSKASWREPSALGARLMRVLVVGTGGREAAIAWACRQHGHDVRVAPDLGDTSAADVDLVIPGPEAALAAGIADVCASRRVPCFGPTAELAQLESSKSYARRLAVDLGIPGPRFASFDDVDAALAWWGDAGFDVVVKADGLLAGKGVVVPTGPTETRAAIAAAGPGPFLLEERLRGPECSLLALCDGTTVVALPLAQDHKRIGEADTGPNTGGMGAYARHPCRTRPRNCWRRSSSPCSTTSPPRAPRTSA